MPAKKTSGAVTLEDVEKALPPSFFVRRGHVRAAFGLSEEEMTALVPDVFHPTYLSPNKSRRRKKSRALFVRSHVIAVARQWEKNK